MPIRPTAKFLFLRLLPPNKEVGNPICVSNKLGRAFESPRPMCLRKWLKEEFAVRKCDRREKTNSMESSPFRCWKTRANATLHFPEQKKQFEFYLLFLYFCFHPQWPEENETAVEKLKRNKNHLTSAALFLGCAIVGYFSSILFPFWRYAQLSSPLQQIWWKFFFASSHSGFACWGQFKREDIKKQIDPASHRFPYAQFK